MANNRKVQGEIDKLIKKIDEGKEVYDEVYEKFKEAPSQALKERFEGDLKKEIKKLQRLREQVKGFIQNPEVKDKRQMEEKRREIEEKMEDFKVCERETKTKAYSKEGLANARNDTSDTPLGHTQNWINDALSALQEQLETAEFDVQEIGGGGGGGKKRRGKGGKNDSDDPRVVRLARLKKHVAKLEQLLRMLTNEELEPTEVDDIEDAINEMIENNANDDYESDVDIYEQFALPEVSAKEEDEEEAEKERQRQIEQAKAAAAALEKKTAAAVIPTAKAEPAKEAAGGRVIVLETKKKDPEVAKNTPTTAASTNDLSTPLSKSKTAATPNASLSAPPSATPPTPASPSAIAAKKQPEAPPTQIAKKVATPASNPSLPLPVQPSSPPHSGPTAANTNNTASSPATGTFPSVPPNINERFTKSNAYMDGPALEEDDGAGLLDDEMDAANDDTFGDDALPVNGATASLADLSSMTAAANNKGDWGKGRPNLSSPSSAPTKQQAPVAPQPAALSPTTPTPPQLSPPSSGANNTAPAAKLNPLALLNKRKEELANMLRPLDVSFKNQPVATDVERHKITPPANPTTTPEYFPDKPFRAFNNPELFRKFDTDSLFFIFYYQQSNYLQFLAAKELKRQGFRYHTKFHTWFQRHEKPTVTNEQFEQGSYIYFDYENGWCQRVKRDFQFKYLYLEDDLE